MEINVQCQQILEGIEQLEGYLQEKIAKEALDLASNYETTRNQELLSRLKKSLLQYTERGKNLVYVGLMGHFSAGKSSTINSLLNLEEESEAARKVDLNPVDKSITLITHSENKDSIFNATKEGLVSIRASFIDSEFLRNIVIADTPGTGDPILASEIARDFLPICDLIVYIFSAAIPLDSADVPLLREKYSQLEFIPIQFVVTRADEFKKNQELPLNTENFDTNKSRIFLSELSQRINHLFKHEPYIDSDSILLINNKPQFNINKLQEFILDFANVSDVESQINIHSHKVIYFKSSAEKLKSFFCNFLLNKLATLSGIIKTSQTNIYRFQGNIKVTNNQLTESWNQKLNSIYIIERELYNKLTPAPELPESVNVFYARSVKSSLLDISIERELDKRITSAKEIIRRNIISPLKKSISENRREINNTLSLAQLNNSTLLRLNFPLLPKEQLFNNVELLPSGSLHSESLNIRHEAEKNIAESQHLLETALENLKQLLAEQSPVKECQSLLSLAVSDLEKDFDAYFDSITVYRSGVFSLNVKEAISKLGLGHRMDDLEADELTAEEKAAIKQEAQDYIFPDISKTFFDALKSMVGLQSRTEELQNKVKAMSSERDITTEVLQEGWKDTQLTIIKNDIADEVISDIRKSQEIVSCKIQETVARLNDEWETEKRKMSAERRKRFAFAFLFSTLGGLFLAFLFVFGIKKGLDNNIFVTVISGVIINLLSNVVGFAYAKVTDKFPVSIKAKESSILGKLREEYLQAIDDSLSNLQDSINLDRRVLFDFWKKLLVTEPVKGWSQRKTSFYEKLENCSEEYSELRQEYLQIVDETTEIASSYFSDPDNNLEKLSEFSSNLQQTAIKPSFELLEETKANLDTVIQKIQSIDFA